jgi:hypothetical protein
VFIAGLVSIYNTVARSFAGSGPCAEKPLFKGPFALSIDVSMSRVFAMNRQNSR